jgi:hypothetical protein
LGLIWVFFGKLSGKFIYNFERENYIQGDRKMKKIYVFAVAGILLGLIPALAAADPIIEDDEEVWEEASEEQECEQEAIKEENKLSDSTSIKSKAKLRLWGKAPINEECPKKYVKIRGVWGLSDDNESDGYFGAKIVRRGRFGVFKGLYNKTDNESYGKVFGIMKKGYFNGRVVNPAGESCKIIGLYHVDKEEDLLKMRWMTRLNSGWAVGKIIHPEEG